MSDIPDDIARISRDTVILIEEATNGYWPDVVEEIIGNAIAYERGRCLTIIQSIETTSAQGKRVIEEIMQKVRGGE